LPSYEKKYNPEHMKYEIVIGLETHVRVGSITKMFGGEPNAVALERDPNINI
jgi:Asp-tRNA(Asn)/Glu-tRNA(Gln) amidotransferase B subunit